MAKESGIPLTVSLDDSTPAAQDISGDVTNADWSTPRGVQDVTGVNAAAMERLLLLADLQATLNGAFNDASNQAHDVLKTVPSTSVTRTLSITISGQVLAEEVIVTDYALARAQDGGLTWTAPCLLNQATAPAWA